jgi:uncharacterized protein YqgC (DUF456 family)
MTIGPFTFTLDVIIKSATIVFMGIGLLVIPILPGLVIIWAAALGYGIAAGFGILGWIMFAIITVLMLAGSILDNVLMSTQAHKEGAPWWVVMIAMVSAIVGSFIIPIPIIGGILTSLAVLFGIQWLRLKNAKMALTSMKGMLIGCGWALVFRIIIGLIMIGLWLIWAWA